MCVTYKNSCRTIVVRKLMSERATQLCAGQVDGSVNETMVDDSLGRMYR